MNIASSLADDTGDHYLPTAGWSPFDTTAAATPAKGAGEGQRRRGSSKCRPVEDRQTKRCHPDRELIEELVAKFVDTMEKLVARVGRRQKD